MPEDTDATEKASCKVCPQGYYQSATLQVVCLKCPEGQHNSEPANDNNDHISCNDCDSGKYADEKGSSDCKSCSEGQYSNSSKSTACTLCSAGQSTNGLDGQDACTPCSPGFFVPQNLKGLGECLVCPTGKESGLTFCEGCPPGRYGSLGDCKPCQSGKYWQGGDANDCRRCEKGKYSRAANETRAVCESCPGGRYSEILGAHNISFCKFCENCSQSKGQFEASKCLDCAPGSKELEASLRTVANLAQSAVALKFGAGTRNEVCKRALSHVL